MVREDVTKAGDHDSTSLPCWAEIARKDATKLLAPATAN